MDIILATGNPGKAVQIQTLFGDSPLRVRAADGIHIPQNVEDGTSEEENSFKKAHYVQERMPGSWVMADDTGIYLTALGGAPGIHAARWAGETATAEEIMHYTLSRLENSTDRSAQFKTAAVLLSPTQERHVFFGEVPGRILEHPRCAPQPGLPYSPIFVPDGEELSWAEMTTEQENRISHRGIAFRKVREFLEHRI